MAQSETNFALSGDLRFKPCSRLSLVFVAMCFCIFIAISKLSFAIFCLCLIDNKNFNSIVFVTRLKVCFAQKGDKFHKKERNITIVPDMFIKSNERREDSYIGLSDTFFRKNLKICSRSVLIFRG